METEVVYQITPLQAWLFIGAGFALMVGFLIIWSSKTKYKKPGIKGKDRYYTQGQVWVAQIFKRQLPGMSLKAKSDSVRPPSSTLDSK